MAINPDQTRTIIPCHPSGLKPLLDVPHDEAWWAESELALFPFPEKLHPGIHFDHHCHYHTDHYHFY